MTTRTPKGSCMTAMSTTSRRGTPRWLVALAASSAAVVVLPSTAIAADAGASTVRATLDEAGGVKDVKVYGPDGAASAFSGNLPVKVAATRSVSAGSTLLSYHVENTMSQKQDVTVTDTAGKSTTSPVELQLPLVAQLGVTLPSSMKDVAAPGATISTDPDGTRHVLWQMVLFSPLGSPSQDVSMTASGDGKPSVQLRATAIDPSNAAGLSGTAQAANASIQQDDFWHGYSSGGNAGLTKLRDGMGQLVAGLQLLAPGAQKLATGLGAAGDGANKLAAGTDKAKSGAGQLSAGLGKISAGQTALTVGLTKIHDGQTALTGGLTQIHTGQGSLTTGLTQIHDGQGALTTGLGQISGGLGQLADPAKGLPAAAAGLTQISAGLSALLAGVGSGDDTAAAKTLVGGVTAVSAGLTQLKTGVQQSAGCSAFLLTKVISGSTADGSTSPCFVSTANPKGFVPTIAAATDPVARAVLTGLRDANAAVAAGTDSSLTPGIKQLTDGLAQIRGGLSHPAGALGATDPGGVSQGLTAVKAGVGLVSDGLAKAVAGVNALNTGAASAFGGSQQLTDGTAKALAGSQQLFDGSGKALAGSQQLTTGSGSALSGSTQLRDGARKAYTGSQALLLGLGQISTGQHQVADGLPAAVTGAAQIAGGLAKVLTGSVAVKDGIGQVQDGAVAPLDKQLAEAAQNARKQVAILTAAGALAAKAPGGAGASYVLDQAGFNPKLSASTSGLGDDSHTGRNVGLGVGALALLLFGTAGGFAAGRRRDVTAP